jgi:hypothetical protein
LRHLYSAVRNVGGIFPPWRHLLEFDSVDYSPSLLKKISWAGGNCNSYQQAEAVLAKIGDIFISYRQIARITDKIGQELLSVRDHRQLVDQTVIPKKPPAAVVSVDGGRVQTREEDNLPGVHNPQWKEEISPISR